MTFLGTVLEFENSLGMLVQGLVEFDGTADRPILMRLKNESTFTNHSLIRMVDGPNELEGRLEVRINETDEWSTICSEVSASKHSHFYSNDIVIIFLLLNYKESNISNL